MNVSGITQRLRTAGIFFSKVSDSDIPCVLLQARNGC